MALFFCVNRVMDNAMASQAFNSIFYDLYDFCTEKHGWF